MELRDYLRVLRKYWVLIVALALLGVAIAATYSLVKTPEYSSSAKVFVSTQSSDNVQELAQGNTFTQQRVKTYADLVSTPIVLLPVVGSLELNITAGELAQQLTASAPLDTTLIEITAWVAYCGLPATACCGTTKNSSESVGKTTVPMRAIGMRVVSMSEYFA